MGYVLEHEDEAERLEWQATLRQYDLRKEFDGLYIKPSSLVLDVGCGTGIVSRYLFESQSHSMFNIEAVDFSDIRLQQARSLTKSKNYSQKINFSQGDIFNLKFKDESFDLVVNRYVFQHLPSLLGAAKEVYRILKPDGEIHVVDHDGIFLSLHTSNNELNDMLAKLGQGLKFDLFAGRKIPAVFKQVGFRNIDWELLSNPFKEQDLLNEVTNTKQRFVFARPVFEKILGGADITDRFEHLYLDEMTSEGSVLFHNTFVVTAKK